MVTPTNFNHRKTVNHRNHYLLTGCACGGVLYIIPLRAWEGPVRDTKIKDLLFGNSHRKKVHNLRRDWTQFIFLNTIISIFKIQTGLTRSISMFTYTILHKATRLSCYESYFSRSIQQVSLDRESKRCRGTRVKSKYKQTSNVIPYNIQYQRQHKNNHAVYARVL